MEPGAVIGKEAEIGRGTTIAAGSVIGYRVHIGRDCFVGPKDIYYYKDLKVTFVNGKVKDIQ